MAKAVIEILGDSSSFQRSTKEAAIVADRLAVDLNKLAITAKASAEMQVAASLHKQARLKGEINAYRSIASAAAIGSKKQVAAAQLAARAEGRLAGSLGITAREQRGLSASASASERSLSRATRGALAGSGIFRGLGRSIAFASGGFLAFASGGQFIRKSIDVAREAQVTQKQLGAQFRASGLSLSTYQGQIDKTNLRLSALAGINKDQLDQSFTTIFRGAGNVTKALKDNAIAADIAAGRNVPLATAAIAVGKAAAGSTTSLRRLGIQLPKGTTGTEALTIAARKFAGQAAAAATEQKKFGSALHNSEVIIGSRLLPTLNQYLARGATWLTQMNESGRLQRDVTHITKDLGHGIHDVGIAAHLVGTIFGGLNKVTGSTENTLKDFAAVWLTLKARTALIKWGFIESGILGIGKKSVIAEGEVIGLRGALASLGGAGVLGGIAAVAAKLGGLSKFAALFGPEAPALSDAFKTLSGQDPFKIAPKSDPLLNYYYKTATNVSHITAAQSKIVEDFYSKKITAGMAEKRLQKLVEPFSNVTGGVGQHAALKANAIRQAKAARDTVVAATRGQKPISLQAQFNLADLKLARAQLTATQADDRAILVTQAAITREQLKQDKSLKDKTADTQKLAGILSQIRSIDQQDAAAAKQARMEARQRLQDALQAREFKVLGLDPTGQAFTPGARALRRELGRVGGALKGTDLDTSKRENELGRIHTLLFGKDRNKLTRDVRSTIRSLLDGIDQQIKAHRSTGPQTKFHAVDTAQVLAGLGLTPAQMKATRARLSQLGAGGTVPASGVGAFGYAQPDTVIHHQTIVDGRVIENTVTRHQQKDRRRNPPQKRGPHAGA